jgi:hypothetical protein
MRLGELSFVGVFNLLLYAKLAVTKLRRSYGVQVGGCEGGAVVLSVSV